MEGIPIDPDILVMTRLEVLQELMTFGRKRGYSLTPSDFAEFDLDQIQLELADLRRHGVNSWVTAIGAQVVRMRR